MSRYLCVAFPNATHFSLTAGSTFRGSKKRAGGVLLMKAPLHGRDLSGDLGMENMTIQFPSSEMCWLMFACLDRDRVHFQNVTPSLQASMYMPSSYAEDRFLLMVKVFLRTCRLHDGTRRVWSRRKSRGVTLPSDKAGTGHKLGGMTLHST